MRARQEVCTKLLEFSIADQITQELETGRAEKDGRIHGNISADPDVGSRGECCEHRERVGATHGDPQYTSGE